MASVREGDRGSLQPPHIDPKLVADVYTNIDAGVYITDDQERIIAVNPRAEKMLALPAAYLLGKDAHDLLHRGIGGRLLPRSQCKLLQAFLSGKVAQGGDKWFARGDGGIIPVHWLTMPYRLANGETGSVVIFTELTEEPTEEHATAGGTTALSDLADSLSLISEVTAVLTSTLEMDEALRRLAWLVVPRLADWAIVDILTEEKELERVLVMHYNQGLHVRVADLEGPMPPLPATSPMPLSRVLRGSPPTWVRPEDYRDTPDSGIAVFQRELFSKTGMHSAVIAPLRSFHDTEVLGALTLGRAESSQEFGSTELALIDDIARRAGLAIDNARLYERQRHVTESMQRHLLPPLPEVDRLEMAAHYRPAPRASEVGGDWYDAFVLPDGATALVIGDVAGHDLQAAANMSQVRNMLRAFAWDHTKSPGMIVHQLDQAIKHLSESLVATMVFARLEGPPNGPWKLRWTNAGHPPPLLVSPDGRTALLENGHDALLGTGLDIERTENVTSVSPMTTIVFYTDGLIESPRQSVEEGLSRLQRHAAALVRRPLNAFCDHLVDRVCPPDNEDDIALLALRLPAEG